MYLAGVAESWQEITAGAGRAVTQFDFLSPATL